jgi:hypothetical protein
MKTIRIFSISIILFSLFILWVPKACSTSRGMDRVLSGGDFNDRCGHGDDELLSSGCISEDTLSFITGKGVAGFRLFANASGEIILWDEVTRTKAVESTFTDKVQRLANDVQEGPRLMRDTNRKGVIGRR